MDCSTRENEEESSDIDYKMISQILLYLSAKELKESRLVNSKFNEIITSTPSLLWGKNMMTIQNPSEDSEWMRIRIHKLVSEYQCPNFHFLKTDLDSPVCIAFFQSSVRYQIKHLKITGCRMSIKVLLQILASCSRTLEHLEISGFSRLKKEDDEGLASFTEIRTNLQSLKILILDNTMGTEIAPNGLSKCLLHNLLTGTRRMEVIKFKGWGAKSCKTFVQTLGAVFHEYLENVRILEITCLIESNLTVFQQYSFVLDIQFLLLSNLKKFCLHFDRHANTPGGLNIQLIDDLSESVATMLDGCKNTVSIIKLVNCPLSNAVLAQGIYSFPNLYNLNTTGTPILTLDQDANPVYDFCTKSQVPFIRNGQKSEDESTIDDGQVYSRIEIYKIAFGFVFCFALFHLGLTRIFSPKIAVQLEVFIHALTVIWLLKRDAISNQWLMFTNSNENDE